VKLNESGLDGNDMVPIARCASAADQTALVKIRTALARR
jgi:hypothetical protein